MQQHTAAAKPAAPVPAPTHEPSPSGPPQRGHYKGKEIVVPTGPAGPRPPSGSAARALAHAPRRGARQARAGAIHPEAAAADHRHRPLEAISTETAGHEGDRDGNSEGHAQQRRAAGRLRAAAHRDGQARPARRTPGMPDWARLAQPKGPQVLLETGIVWLVCQIERLFALHPPRNGQNGLRARIAAALVEMRAGIIAAGLPLTQDGWKSVDEVLEKVFDEAIARRRDLAPLLRGVRLVLKPGLHQLQAPRTAAQRSEMLARSEFLRQSLMGRTAPKGR